jgi:hypothetical protein
MHAAGLSPVWRRGLGRESHSGRTDSRYGAGGSGAERGGQISVRTRDSATGVDTGHPVRSLASPARAVPGVATDVGRLRTSSRCGAHDSGVCGRTSFLAVECIAHRRERETGAAVGAVVVTAGRADADAFRRQTLRSGDSERRSIAFYSRSGSGSFPSAAGAGIVGGSHVAAKWTAAADSDGSFQWRGFPPAQAELTTNLKPDRTRNASGRFKRNVLRG